jgi:hypothetical protein
MNETYLLIVIPVIIVINRLRFCWNKIMAHNYSLAFCSINEINNVSRT